MLVGFAVVMFFVAIIAAIVAIWLQVTDEGSPVFAWLTAGIFLIFGLLSAGGAFIVTVDDTEFVVPVVFGEAKEAIVDPGINIINPFADRISMPLKETEVTFQGTLEDAQKEGRDTDLIAIQALSSEGGDVGVDVTILYSINPAQGKAVYKRVGTNWEGTIIRPFTRTAVRDCLPRFDIEEARTAKRGEAQICIFDQMEAALAARGIVLVEVLLRGMDVDAELQSAINQKLQAQNDVQEAEFRQDQAVVENATKILQAEAAKAAAILEAEARAESLLVEAQAEADANRLLAASLLNEKVFQLRAIEALDLGTKATILSLNDIAPFLNLGTLP